MDIVEWVCLEIIGIGLEHNLLLKVAYFGDIFADWLQEVLGVELEEFMGFEDEAKCLVI